MFQQAQRPLVAGPVALRERTIYRNLMPRPAGGASVVSTRSTTRAGSLSSSKRPVAMPDWAKY